MRTPVPFLIAALAIGCGGSSVTDPTTGSAPTVNAVGETAWSPASITIRAGETVDFRNATGETHNVRFDGGQAGRPADVGNFNGATRSVAFLEAGTYAYHCGIHPVMQGVVVVQP